MAILRFWISMLRQILPCPTMSTCPCCGRWVSVTVCLCAILGNKNLDSDWNVYTQTLADMGLEKYVDLVELYISSVE